MKSRMKSKIKYGNEKSFFDFAKLIQVIKFLQSYKTRKAMLEQDFPVDQKPLITPNDIAEIFDGGMPTAALEYLCEPPCGRTVFETLNRLKEIKQEIKHPEETFLNSIYGIGKDDTDSDEILDVILTFFGWMTTGDYGIINSVLKSAKVRLLSTDLLVAMLRTTGRKREKLPEWKSFYERVYIELLYRELDAEALLQGLMKE